MRARRPTSRGINRRPRPPDAPGGDPFAGFAGAGQIWTDQRIGRFAGAVVARTRPDLCYTFTQVGLETLRWAAAAGVPSILESPNGHLRAFRAVYVSEATRWCDGRYLGPSDRKAWSTG